MIHKTILDAFVDFIWPPQCNICDVSLQDDEEIICKSCRNGIILFSPPVCFHCGLPLYYRDDTSPRVCACCAREKDDFDRCFVIGSYKGVLREAIHKFKYNKRVVLRKYFAEIINDYIQKNSILEGIEIIVPVPLFKTKKRERGFNQAELLAEGIGERWNLPVLLKSICRRKPTVPQSELDYKERKENIKNAFGVIDRDSVEGRNVMLVDDIITSRATVNECSRILKEEGKVKNIFVLALAAKSLS